MRALLRLGGGRVAADYPLANEAVTLALQHGIIPWLVLSPASDLQVGPTMERLDRTAAGPTSGRAPGAHRVGIPWWVSFR